MRENKTKEPLVHNPWNRENDDADEQELLEREARNEANLLSRYEGALEAREPEGDVW